jgi:hypothetical protein
MEADLRKFWRIPLDERQQTMPTGFFTIEQWKRPRPRAALQWIAVANLDAGKSLADAIKQIETMGKSGLYRVVQTPRTIWAEREGNKLRLRKWHAMSAESLARLAKAYERDHGVWPVQKERAERARANRTDRNSRSRKAQ